VFEFAAYPLTPPGYYVVNACAQGYQDEQEETQVSESICPALITIELEPGSPDPCGPCGTFAYATVGLVLWLAGRRKHGKDGESR